MYFAMLMSTISINYIFKPHSRHKSVQTYKGYIRLFIATTVYPIISLSVR